MKKKLLLFTSLIMIATSLAGCGEVTVSYKGIRSPISSSKSSKSSSSSKSISTSVGEYVSPYVAYGYDETYYMPDYNTFSTVWSQEFKEDSSINTSNPIYNVTPRSILTYTDKIQIMHFTYNTYIYFVDKHQSFPLNYAVNHQIMQMGICDYDSNGIDDIVVWAQSKQTSEYIINIFNTANNRYFTVTKLSYEHPDDLLFFIYNYGFYVNQHKVYYVNGQFYCTGVFDYVYPTNIY